MIWVMICQITSSSRLFESTIETSGNPAELSILEAWMLRYARSPESSRMPKGVCPFLRSSSKTLIALGIPLSKELIVSTNNSVSSG